MSANTHPALPEPQYRRSAKMEMFGQKDLLVEFLARKTAYRHSNYFKLTSSTLETVDPLVSRTIIAKATAFNGH